MRISTLVAAAVLLCASPVRAQESAPFTAVTQAIERGDFQSVTSVLVARHGQVIYEHYFDDGGPTALRNTRSATKTITGMLVGAAVDRALLRTDAHVLDESGHWLIGGPLAPLDRNRERLVRAR